MKTRLIRYRSAITGRFVRLAVWRRWPKTTVAETERPLAKPDGADVPHRNAPSSEGASSGSASDRSSEEERDD